MRTLVTGGAGFLGLPPVRAPVQGGPRGALPRQLLHRPQHNIAHLLDNPLFELIRHDVTFPLYVEVDEIYNLACPASPVHYQPTRCRPPRRRVHGASTCSASPSGVGAASCRPRPARSTATRRSIRRPRATGATSTRSAPRSCYDEGKRCAETLFFDYHRQHGLDIKVARIFNTYGPRMHPNDGRVVSQLHRAGAAGEAAHRLRRRRTDALVLLRRRPGARARAHHGHGRRRHRPVNLGNPHEFTIRELAERVIG